MENFNMWRGKKKDEDRKWASEPDSYMMHILELPDCELRWAMISVLRVPEEKVGDMQGHWEGGGEGSMSSIIKCLLCYEPVLWYLKVDVG